MPEDKPPQNPVDAAILAAIRQLVASEGKAEKLEVVRRVHESGTPKNEVMGRVQLLTMKKEVEENAGGELSIVVRDSC